MMLDPVSVAVGAGVAMIVCILASGTTLRWVLAGLREAKEERAAAAEFHARAEKLYSEMEQS